MWSSFSASPPSLAGTVSSGHSLGPSFSGMGNLYKYRTVPKFISYIVECQPGWYFLPFKFGLCSIVHLLFIYLLYVPGIAYYKKWAPGFLFRQACRCKLPGANPSSMAILVIWLPKWSYDWWSWCYVWVNSNMYWVYHLTFQYILFLLVTANLYGVSFIWNKSPSQNHKVTIKNFFI